MHKEQLNTSVQRNLNQQGCSWDFNSPHDSHMRSSWEYLIGMARRILDSMLREQFTCLTHDVLCTLMAEGTAIINARSLTSVSNDLEDLFILSPAILLTQNVGVPPPPGNFTDKDLLTKQWRQVQAHANKFYNRRSREYLLTLQHWREWTRSHQHLQGGDIMLLGERLTLNNWPMAVITKTVRVRKVEIKTDRRIKDV